MQKYQLGDLLDKIVGGGTPSKQNSAYWDGNIPWASVKDMPEDRYRLKDTTDHISEVGLKNSSSNLIPSGTVITSTRMGLGRCFINEVDMAINQDLKALVPNDKIYKEFLLWWLVSKAKELESIGTGTTVKGIRLEQLRALEVLLPNKELQVRIASILSAFDDLLENNTRRIEILEEIARLIYREWFVHYRYPGYENDKLVDSGTDLGEIPEGWEIKELGEVIEINKGKNITKKTANTDGAVPVVAGGLEPAYMHDTPNTKHPVITVSASGANAGYVNLYELDVWASDCSYIDLEATEQVYFYYSLMKYRQVDIFHMQHGSAQPHVYPKDLNRLEIALPSFNLIKKFQYEVSPMFSQIKILTKQIEKLKETRDLLLPKLISGKIEV